MLETPLIPFVFARNVLIILICLSSLTRIFSSAMCTRRSTLFRMTFQAIFFLWIEVRHVLAVEYYLDASISISYSLYTNNLSIHIRASNELI